MLMRKWTRATSLLFLGVASVYSFGALSVAAEKKANDTGGAKPQTEVKILDESAGPVLASAAPATTKPADVQPAASQVTVSDAGTVEIHVADASLPEVLRMIS